MGAMRQSNKENLNKTVMELCDDLRDVRLVDLGVRLEDKTDETGNPIIKLADRETLIRERDEKALMKAQAAEKKRLAAEKKAKEEAEKDKIAQIDPTNWFKVGTYEDKFLTFNEKGIPLTRKNEETGEEEEIPKAQSKKLAKEMSGQEKRHKAW